MSLRSLLFPLLLTLSLASCYKDKAPDVDNSQEEPLSSQTTEIQQMTSKIIYLEGLVYIGDEDQRKEALIGDEIFLGNRIEVTQGSYCEVQLGDLSILYLEAETIASLSRNMITPQGSQGSWTLEEGSVMAKVRKLTDKDAFDVQTQSTVCGVRGTEFLVYLKDNNVTVAVVEGSVALAPAGLELSGGDQEDEALKGVIQKIEGSLPLVEAGEEVTLSPQDLNDMEVILLEAQDLIDQGFQDSETSNDNLNRLENLSQNLQELSRNKEEGLTQIKETTH
ncbi:MAG: FecR family protein, partial [Spirochaetaceae bacterium]|nr:FecR family protein [Spirochaetaceae bacterium]